jgi:hydroxypyruvate isomerase
MHALPFAVNLSILFTEWPMRDRPARAREAGFEAVEAWWPFSSPTPDDGDVDEFLGALSAADVRLVALNAYAGDMAAGDRGAVGVPPLVDGFRRSIDTLCHVADATGCRLFNALYGIGADDALATESLGLFAERVAGFDGTVLVEPLTATENAGYPLQTASDVVAVLERLRAGGTANARFLADLYHLANNGEDLTTLAERHVADIAHVQIADAPGRNEPGTGTLPLDATIRSLEASGYSAYVACEYRPSGRSEDSFAWLPVARRGSRRDA